MRYAIYIAAAAVVGLLIGFVALSIGWLCKSVTRNIRTKTLGLLDAYDDLLEEKSRELARLERELREKSESQEPAQGDGEPAADANIMEAGPVVLRAAERAGAAVYRGDSVGSDYCAIREQFSFRLDDVLAAVGDCTGVTGGPASRLLEAIDFDTVFQLSTMREDQQVEILQEALGDDFTVMLESYMAMYQKFQILNFYDYLKTAAAGECQPVRILVPERVGAWGAGEVEIVPDSGICEGFQVEIDHRLYDYSIQSRELN